MKCKGCDTNQTIGKMQDDGFRRKFICFSCLDEQYNERKQVQDFSEAWSLN